jgi:FtsP/CotA-like multicopper oxidase with cupredoxin domain
MKVIILISLFLISHAASAKTVKYELIATKERVNISGKKTVDFAILINKSIPAPALVFTEGDDAEITLMNNLSDDEVSIHWHGILLDPYMDGVPYVNTPPIRPGEKFVFKFKIRQHGTFWYHSHTNVQEQKGVYGAFVIHPKEEIKTYDKEIILVLSDWSDENSSHIIQNLKKDGDYYIYKKGTVRSWLGAIKSKSVTSYLSNLWNRMEGMDFSDVGYDAFLINGKTDFQEENILPGDRIRLRIINASSSTYFYVSLGDGPMKVISADGVDIKPKLASEILMGMAETYDVSFTANKIGSYEFKATSMDGTGSASIWLGRGERHSAPVKALPDLYMNMSSSMGPMDHSKMKMDEAPMDHSKMKMDEASMDHANMDIKTELINVLTSADLESPHKTTYESNLVRKDITLTLDGDMNRYVWFINGKAINEERTLTINENEVVRFSFINNTMMNHPMHLHGHFFRVLNKYGDSSPLKHTIDVPPFENRTIEFLANEPGEWMLHCHNVYHLNSGMARVVKYSTFVPKSEIKEFQKNDPHLNDHIFHNGSVEISTNHRAEVKKDSSWDSEGDLFYKRWLSKYSKLILGGSYFDKEVFGNVGLNYTLPLLIEATVLIDNEKKLRLDLNKRFQWTKFFFTEADFTFRQEKKTEFEISLMYQKDWAWSAGFMFTENNVGIGAQYNF